MTACPPITPNGAGVRSLEEVVRLQRSRQLAEVMRALWDGREEWWGGRMPPQDVATLLTIDQGGDWEHFVPLAEDLNRVLLDEVEAAIRRMVSETERP